METPGRVRRTDGVLRSERARHLEVFQRERRFEKWENYPDPDLEDWLELLDGVRRRIPRRKMEPADEQRLVRTIKEKFPDQKDQV